MKSSFKITTHLTQITVIIFLMLPLSPSSFLAESIQTSILQRPFNKIYAFGDSFTDTGNTNSSSGSHSSKNASNLPYGETFFHHPTNRFSDGRLIIDFIAQALSLPLLPPYRNSVADFSHGVNFAVAGSTAIPYGFFLKNNLTKNRTPESLETQLSWFNEILVGKGCIDNSTTPTECRGVFDDSLIWVGEIGANDYGYSVRSSVSSNTIQELAISIVTDFLKVLLRKGAKYLVVQGLPPLGCLTASMAISTEDDRDALGCAKSLNPYNYNIALLSILSQLRKQFPRAVIIYADYWNSYDSVLRNAKTYGFKEPFKVCCGFGGGLYNYDASKGCGTPFVKSCPNPSEYINWDGVHLTEAMYKRVADSFLDGRFCDPPFDYLLMRMGRDLDRGSSISVS